MVQALIHLEERSDRVLTIVRGKYGLKNKSDAVNFVLTKFEEELLEPSLRPEYIEKIHNLEKKGKFKQYSSFDEFERDL